MFDVFDNTEQATSPNLVEPNWAAILQVCDSIRQNDVRYVYSTEKFNHVNKIFSISLNFPSNFSAKVAVNEIKKKVHDSNSQTSKNALIVSLIHYSS